MTRTGLWGIVDVVRRDAARPTPQAPSARRGVRPARPLQTFGDLARRQYKRDWRAANPDKARLYHARSIVRQIEREARARP